jgi:2-oxoglutarate dehydrogenase dihydrolipoamide succinyltransferase (E2 component)
VTSIQMPQLGETIIEGTILKWLKAEGETIERDEPLFEISTDKVDTEVPSPVSGVVSKILVAEGETVAVGTELAVVDDGTEEAASASTVSKLEESAGSSAPAAAPAEAEADRKRDTPSPSAPLPERGPRSQILSPLVRRLASEHGVDLSQVVGTGTGGRITKADVQTVIARGGSPASVPQQSPTGAGEEIVAMSHIRKAIAQHMQGSVQTTARAWTMVEVNVESLVRLRTQVKEAFLLEHGVKLTYLPFVTRAATDALQAFPEVNARLQGDDIVYHHYVNMGIAVSYDQGLIVPVIRGADGMNAVGIARAIADLAARARSHELKPDEVQGATFTITNPGPYGSIASVPIINQPNTGILSLDAIQKRPVVVEGDAIAVRNMVNISMSWDHRVIDGELATRFMARVKQNLETWDFAEDLGL